MRVQQILPLAAASGPRRARSLRVVWLSLIVACFSPCAIAGAASLGLDDFSDPAAIYFANDWSGSQLSSSIIGGQRDMSVDVVGYAYPNSLVGLVGHDTTPGYDVNALQIGMAGWSPTVVTLQYCGVHEGTDNAYALGGAPGQTLDLTNSGAYDSFGLHFLSLDSQLEVSFTITSPLGSDSGALTSTVVRFIPPSPGPFEFDIPFGFLLGNADPTHADSVTVVFNGNKQTNIDFEVNLGAVPEPASVVLIVTGLVAVCGLGLQSRGRRKETGTV